MTVERTFERDPDLCVITCALTGVLANRQQCAGIPYTPVEIAEEAKRAYDAGAAAADRSLPRESPITTDTATNNTSEAT